MSQSRTALPQWLSDYRPEAALAPEALQRKALAEVADWGLPGRQDEEWRWTPLRPLTLLQPKANPVNAGAAPLAAVLPEALVIRFVAGKLLALPANLPAGLSVRNLADAEEHLRAAAFAPTARNANDTLLALNTAHASAGIVIELAPNTVLDQPILIDWQDDGDGYAATRTLLRLGAHSQLTLIESVHAHTPPAHWRNHITVIEQCEHSALDHITLGLDGDGRLLTDRQFVHLPRDARYTSINLQLGGQLIRREIDVNITDSGAHCDLFGLMMPRGKQLMDTHTRLTHGAAHTTSDERYQIIADDAGRGIFKGRILVAQDAQKIAAYQNSRNLLLSPQAEINTKPELEIYADDVKCSHGATIGQLDPEALYYLKSRGIGEATARQMLIGGFAEEILATLPSPALASYLTEYLNRHPALVHEKADG